ncbi:MAG TPA: hypothetical protein PKV71_18965 [Calditrichia bacterium]|nr:hypothetical protein [Calditrichia bacterium]
MKNPLTILRIIAFASIALSASSIVMNPTPGAIFRLILTGILGYYLLQGNNAARWAFAVFSALGGVGMLFFLHKMPDLLGVLILGGFSLYLLGVACALIFYPPVVQFFEERSSKTDDELKTVCPHCQAKLELERAELLAKAYTCPNCKQDVQI